MERLRTEEQIFTSRLTKRIKGCSYVLENATLSLRVSVLCMFLWGLTNLITSWTTTLRYIIDIRWAFKHLGSLKLYQRKKKYTYWDPFNPGLQHPQGAEKREHLRVIGGRTELLQRYPRCWWHHLEWSFSLVFPSGHDSVCACPF